MTSWDDWRQRHNAAPEFQALLSEGNEKGYFVPGSLQRSLHEVISH